MMIVGNDNHFCFQDTCNTEDEMHGKDKPQVVENKARQFKTSNLSNKGFKKLCFPYPGSSKLYEITWIIQRWIHIVWWTHRKQTEELQPTKVGYISCSTQHTQRLYVWECMLTKFQAYCLQQCPLPPRLANPTIQKVIAVIPPHLDLKKIMRTPIMVSLIAFTTT